MSYLDLWAVLSCWRREFSAGEFARTFSSPSPRKVLHDMARKGLLEHAERGRYRVKSLDDYARTRTSVSRGYELLTTAGLPYALTGVDGVLVWTRGGYNADRFFGFYPIHLKVLTSDLSRWHRFLRRAGMKSLVAGRRPKMTLFGVFYLLYPVENVEAKTVRGLKVEPFKEAVEFCKKHIYTFAPALEILERENRPARVAAR